MKYSFTIITACYNGAEYITKCAESIANANYDHDLIEHIIINDGSTDDTEKVCKELAKKYKHIKFYSKPNGNWGSVINYVRKHKLVHNDYVLLCDSDDFLLPKAFEKINKKIKGVDLFAASFYRWNGKKTMKYTETYYRLLPRTFKNVKHKYYSPLLCVQTGVVRKEIFYQSPKLFEKISYQDTILFCSWLEKARTIRYTPSPISVYWCQRPGNSMSQFKKEEGYKKWLMNFEQFSKKDWIDPFASYLFGNKDLRKYMKKHNIKFSFKTKMIHCKYIPVILRPILKLLFLIMIKKFIKK